MLNECWLWTGAKNSNGYGTTRVAGRSTYVHRAVYEAVVGPIPDGLEMDHLCRVRHCYNPRHLEAVTHAENNRRKPPTPPRTHCPAGHRYAGTRQSGGGLGKPFCRTCNRERMAASRRLAVAA